MDGKLTAEDRLVLVFFHWCGVERGGREGGSSRRSKGCPWREGIRIQYISLFETLSVPVSTFLEYGMAHWTLF